MTKEQAIEILKTDSCVDCGVGSQSPYACTFDGHCDIKDAMKLIIEVLEQQSCEDCVSRKELLKLYGNRAFELQKTHQTDKQLGINWCINTLKEMPPVTPTHGTCKDCTNYVVGALDEEICIRGHELIHKDFYCRDFKKRGTEND